MQCEGDERRDRTLDGSCAHRYYMYMYHIHITNQQRKSLVHVDVQSHCTGTNAMNITCKNEDIQPHLKIVTAIVPSITKSLARGYYVAGGAC